MLPDPFTAWVPTSFRVKLAASGWERAGAARLRRMVFCEEQGIFDGDDRDDVDDMATTIVALSTLAGDPDEVVGTVRIHESGTGVWHGSRLAVEPGCRRLGAVGTSLIRVAVGTAHAQGCVRFLAHVQSQNELLFRRLHWRRLEEIELHGRPHVLMQADLAHYPPLGSDGLLALRAA